jgi:oxygen-dependent protoporphyrinogen oxidase
MRVAVVGAGIAGLAAAHALAVAGASVQVFEKGSTVGGALRTTPLAGLPVEEGADAFLVRVPWAADLAGTAGLTLVHPTIGAASIYAAGRLRPLPTGTMLGVPSSLASVRGVLSTAGLARAALDRVLPASTLGDDPSVGALVRARLGGQVLDRLVDPLLGGVYAGSADGLSVAMTAPALRAADRSLLSTVAARRPPPVPGPVFASTTGGLGAFPAALAAGLDVQTTTTVTGLERVGASWTVATGPAGRQQHQQVDAVVLAVPAAAAARLLAGVLPAPLLPATRYASVAIVTLLYPAGTQLPAGSGILIAPSARRMVKAVTFVGAKWGHPAGSPVVVRASVGRFGQEQDLRRPDVELAGVAAADVAAVAGVVGRPMASRVSRWGGALPQYAPGHLVRSGATRAALPAGIVLAGAAYDGVGIPACVRSGQESARQVLALLGG